MSFLPCELHCHTVHSDGGFQVSELLKSAAEEELSLIALTDHNTFSGYSELDDTVLPAIRGIEWTTYFGHMLVLGAQGFVDWRDAVPDNIDEKIKEVKAAGGAVGIAHPFQIGSPVCTGGRWEFKVNNWENVDYMEIWHEDLSEVTGENEKALKLWTSLLDRGYKLAASYGRDWHRPEKSGHYGCTYIDFDGEVNQENALSAVKHGRTVVSMGAKFCFTVRGNDGAYSIGDTVKEGVYTFGFLTDLSARRKNTDGLDIKYNSIRIVTNSSMTAAEAAPDEKGISLRLEKSHWYRAELWGSVDGVSRPLAVTSPIYCE